MSIACSKRSCPKIMAPAEGVALLPARAFWGEVYVCALGLAVAHAVVAGFGLRWLLVVEWSKYVFPTLTSCSFAFCVWFFSLFLLFPPHQRCQQVLRGGFRLLAGAGKEEGEGALREHKYHKETNKETTTKIIFVCPPSYSSSFSFFSLRLFPPVMLCLMCTALLLLY